MSKKRKLEDLESQQVETVADVPRKKKKKDKKKKDVDEETQQESMIIQTEENTAKTVDVEVNSNSEKIRKKKKNKDKTPDHAGEDLHVAAKDKAFTDPTKKESVTLKKKVTQPTKEKIVDPAKTKNKNKQTDATNKSAELYTKQTSTQNLLMKKLQTIKSKSGRSNINVENKVETKQETIEPVSDKGNSVEQTQTKTKQQKADTVQLGANPDTSAVEEEEDPEKVEMRKKKREKRKQKKLEKEKRKKEQALKAGTGKVEALKYLETWKTKKNEWKFSKVRQCWLLQNMYKPELVSLAICRLNW